MSSALEFPLSSFSNRCRQPFEVQATVEETELAKFDEEIRLYSPISVSGEAYRDDDEVQIKLRVSVEAEYVCGRCLDPIHDRLDVEFRVLYRPMRERPPFLEDEDEIGLSYYAEGMINLCDDIRRYLLLEIPLWPVCRETCQGLCHQCGANLNREECRCEQKKGGPARTRFAEELDRLFG